VGVSKGVSKTTGVGGCNNITCVISLKLGLTK